MYTWTDTAYTIPDTTQPHVTLHDSRVVSFHLPGYMLDGRGFSLYLSTAHIPAIEDLLLTLKTLRDPSPPENSVTIDLDAGELAVDTTR